MDQMRNCYRCKRGVFTAWKTFKGQYYHPHCFTCTICDVVIQSEADLQKYELKELYCPKCLSAYFSGLSTHNMLRKEEEHQEGRKAMEDVVEEITLDEDSLLYTSDFTAADELVLDPRMHQGDVELTPTNSVSFMKNPLQSYLPPASASGSDSCTCTAATDPEDLLSPPPVEFRLSSVIRNTKPKSFCTDEERRLLLTSVNLDIVNPDAEVMRSKREDQTRIPRRVVSAAANPTIVQDPEYLIKSRPKQIRARSQSVSTTTRIPFGDSLARRGSASASLRSSISESRSNSTVARLSRSLVQTRSQGTHPKTPDELRTSSHKMKIARFSTPAPAAVPTTMAPKGKSKSLLSLPHASLRSQAVQKQCIKSTSLQERLQGTAKSPAPKKLQNSTNSNNANAQNSTSFQMPKFYVPETKFSLSKCNERFSPGIAMTHSKPLIASPEQVSSGLKKYLLPQDILKEGSGSRGSKGSPFAKYSAYFSQGKQRKGSSEEDRDRGRPPIHPRTASSSRNHSMSSVSGSGFELRNQSSYVSGLDCPICLEKLVGSVVKSQDNGSKENVVTHCGHIFHKSCIGNWLQADGNGRCPICSKIILKESIIPVYIEANVADSLKNADSDELKAVLHTLRTDFKQLREKYQTLLMEHSECQTRVAITESLRSAYDMETRTRGQLQWENKLLRQKLQDIKSQIAMPRGDFNDMHGYY